MKACADCVPCLMRRVLFQSRMVGDPNEFRTMHIAAKTYSDLMSPDICSAEIATAVHGKAYESMGCDDPYRQMKIDADEVAQQYVPEAQSFIDSSDDRFAAAVRACIVGNIMDFGSGIAIDSPSEFGRVFRSLLEQGIGLDQTEELRRLVESSDTVLYAFDNCGEDVFDKLFIREIKSMGKRVVAVVRGKPILNDVTMEDALRVGMDREVDRIVSTGEFAVGFPRVNRDPGFNEELPKAGVMIVKGMANYEALSDFDYGISVAFLLRAKCIPVARSIGVEPGTNVVLVKQ